MTRIAVTAAAVFLLAVATPSASSAVESGKVVPFQGVAGVSLQHTRATVIARVGPPVTESLYGVMSYSKTGILDVYLTRPGRRGRVRQIVVAGSGFCARGVAGACSFAPNSEIAMRRAYPRKFRRVVDDTGDTIFWWCGRVRGRAVSTSFNTDPRRHMILTWYVTDHGRRCPTLAQVRVSGD